MSQPDTCARCGHSAAAHDADGCKQPHPHAYLEVCGCERVYQRKKKVVKRG